MTMTSRVRRYDINPRLFPMAFETGLKLEVTKGIPRDARFRGYTIDPAKNCISIFLEHESFEEVEEHSECPVAEPLEVKRLDWSENNGIKTT